MHESLEQLLNQIRCRDLHQPKSIYQMLSIGRRNLKAISSLGNCYSACTEKLRHITNLENQICEDYNSLISVFSKSAWSICKVAKSLKPPTRESWLNAFFGGGYW